MDEDCPRDRVNVFYDNPPNRLKPEEMKQSHLSSWCSRKVMANHFVVGLQVYKNTFIAKVTQIC